MNNLAVRLSLTIGNGLRLNIHGRSNAPMSQKSPAALVVLLCGIILNAI